jgi:fumarate reductase subunit D
MSVSRKLLTEGEHEVLSVRTHVKALFLPALVLLLTCLVAGFAWGYAPDGDSGRYLGYAALVVAALVILVWAVAPFVTV